VKDRPILFSGAMVRAILADRKTQTRRILNPRGRQMPSGGRFAYNGYSLVREDARGVSMYPMPPCPYGVAGERLWVRETWAAPHDCDAAKPSELPDGTRIHYRAAWDGPCGLAWRPSIFLQRRFARLVLEVTNVRVERLNDISRDDAKAEGIIEVESGGPPWHVGYTDVDHGDALQAGHITGPVGAFRGLWDSINGKRAPWSSNPYVWVVSFRRIEPKAVAA
jgi:hypothetical protein